MRRLLHAALLLTVVIAIAYRATVTDEAPLVEKKSGFAGSFEDRWSAYVDRVSAAGLQQDCIPRRIEPSADYRGTVALFHGFGACPQQFFLFSDALAEQGYRVLLMLLPGHGRAPVDATRDNLGDMPTTGNWLEAYGQLATELNAIMRAADGERVIGGLSAGGAASLFVHLQDRGLYDRQLMLSPFFAPGGGWAAGSGVAITARTAGLRAASVKPGSVKDPCLEKRGRGRAGYCNYQLRHVGPLQALAKHNLRAIREAPLEARVQLAGVERDTVVNNNPTLEFLAAQQVTEGTTACFYEAGVPHALIATFDNTPEEMYWLDSLVNDVAAFIASGSSFPTNGTVSAAESPHMQCSIAG